VVHDERRWKGHVQKKKEHVPGLRLPPQGEKRTRRSSLGDGRLEVGDFSDFVILLPHFTFGSSLPLQPTPKT
jgi:hypothetical protein